MKNQTHNQKKIDLKIGAKLRQARLNHHYSLNDLYRKTKIQKKYLNDIEDGNLRKLPGAFYLKSFIHKYADSVGINGREFLKSHNNELPDLKDPRFVSKISSNHLLTNINKRHSTERHSLFQRYLPVAISIGIILVILVGIWLLTLGHKNGFHQVQQTSTTISGEAYHSGSHHPEHPKIKHRQRTRIKKISGRGHHVIYRVSVLDANSKLTIRSANRAWVSIKVGRHSLRSPQGIKRIKTLKLSKKSKKLWFVLGNAPQTKIRINNKLLKTNPRIRMQLITLEIN